MARDWLVRGQPARSRSWALEEQLFAESRSRERQDALRALAQTLGEDQAKLARMEAELHEQALRVAELQGQLRAAGDLGESLSPGQTEAAGDDRPRRRTVDPRHSLAGPQQEYWLCRCEGFEVESPDGRIGVVEGLRFISRLDQPDLLEVRAGFLGRRLLLPVEQVASISSDEERIVLRTAPHRNGDYVSELYGRVRSRLSGGP